MFKSLLGQSPGNLWIFFAGISLESMLWTLYPEESISRWCQTDESCDARDFLFPDCSIVGFLPLCLWLGGCSFGGWTSSGIEWVLMECGILSYSKMLQIVLGAVTDQLQLFHREKSLLYSFVGCLKMVQHLPFCSRQGTLPLANHSDAACLSQHPQMSHDLV